MCFIVSSVGLVECKAIALVGHNSVLSTARPRNKKFPQTCWMNFLPLMSISGAFDRCAILLSHTGSVRLGMVDVVVSVVCG